MKKLITVLVALSIAVALLFATGVVAVVVQAAPAEGQEATVGQDTCPDDGNWLKVEPIGALSYLYEAPEGMEIRNTCYKAGSNAPVYDGPFIPGLLSYLFESTIPNPNGNNMLEISHISVELYPIETPTEVPPTPTETEVPPTPTETEVPPTPTETEVPPTDEPTATPTEVPAPVKPECPDCGAPVRELLEENQVRILKGSIEKCDVVKVDKEWKLCFGNKDFKTYTSANPFKLFAGSGDVLEPESHVGADGITYYYYEIFGNDKNYGPMILLGPAGLGDDGIFQDEDRFEGDGKSWVICSAWPGFFDTTADGYGVIRPGHTASDWFEFLWEEGFFDGYTWTEAWNWAMETIDGLKPGNMFKLP